MWRWTAAALQFVASHQQCPLTWGHGSKEELCHRNPREYFKIFDGIETREKDGRYAHYELLSCKPVDAYCRIKKNQNQVRWLHATTTLRLGARSV